MGGFRLDEPEGEVGIELADPGADPGAGSGDGVEPQVVRVLRAGSDTEERRGHVATAWRLPSGPAEFRGVFAVLAAPGA